MLHHYPTGEFASCTISCELLFRSSENEKEFEDRCTGSAYHCYIYNFDRDFDFSVVSSALAG